MPCARIGCDQPSKQTPRIVVRDGPGSAGVALLFPVELCGTCALDLAGSDLRALVRNAGDHLRE